MKRGERDYKKGKIYSLRTDTAPDLIYIGSTCSSLSKRLYKHRSCYKGWKANSDHYRSAFEILKYDDHYIELIEEFPCENKITLLRREGEIQRAHKNRVNKEIAGRTPVEYEAEHRTRKSKWYKKNRDRVLEKCRIVVDCERCDRSVTLPNLKRHQKTIYCTNFKK